MQLPPAPSFASDDEYERSLRDAAFWEPYARAALSRSGLPDAGDVRTHFPTTHVAVRVGEHLVKLHYEEWFGEESFRVEREAYRVLAAADLPVPTLLAEGSLYPDGDAWRWPYLVLSVMHGRALRDVADATAEDGARVAAFLGTSLRAMHAVPIVEGEDVSYEIYCDHIQTRMQRCGRDHQQWGSLPVPLADTVRDYVWDARALIDPERERAVFLHGDLHDGNVFVDGAPGSLRPTGIVDFNDAYEGDPHYDLVAIHAKTFGGDKALLRAFLEAYGWDDLGTSWPRRMMALTIAHDYDMIQPLAARYGDRLASTSSLDELATLLWDLDAPGLD